VNLGMLLVSADMEFSCASFYFPAVLSPRSSRDGSLLDTPVVHDLSVDEPVDRDCGTCESLALLRGTRPLFADIRAEDAKSQYHFVIDRENIINLRMTVDVVRMFHDCRGKLPRTFQPAGPARVPWGVEPEVFRADLVDRGRLALAEFFEEFK